MDTLKKLIKVSVLLQVRSNEIKEKKIKNMKNCGVKSEIYLDQ